MRAAMSKSGPRTEEIVGLGKVWGPTSIRDQRTCSIYSRIHGPFGSLA